WGAELEGARAVVNLAGESVAGGRWTASRKRRIRESRLASTRAVCRAIERASERPEVLLQGSAVGFYGPREGDGRLTEDSGPGDDFLARVTIDWEAASRPVEEIGVRRCLLRTGVVLSTAGGALPQMALPFKLFAGGPAGDGSQWVPWIHLRDEVLAIRFLLETAAARGPFNLTAPEPVTNRELSRALGAALGRPSLLRAPSFALRLALGEMAEVVLEGQRAVPERLLAAGFEFEFPDVRTALADLYR
ncbi:MAG: TIGR01777 family oxidoreductase, partial [Acidobacteriota bacterium]